MNRNKWRIGCMSAVASLMLLGTSCTKNFEKYNTDPASAYPDQLKADFNDVGGYYPQIQQGIFFNYNFGAGKDWTYQLTQNLNADIFSGYMATRHNFAGGINNTTFFLMDGWNFAAWDYTYSYTMLPIRHAEEKTKNVYPDFYAIAKILKVEVMHRITDQYGPIVYTHYGEGETGGTYDSQEQAYNQFFLDLKEGVSTLETFVQAHPTLNRFSNFDLAYGGDLKQWIKFGNSLRLRLAIRISKVNPDKAKAEAEAAIADPGGMISTNGDNFTISGQGYTNPLGAISPSWQDIQMSANMESILGGYKDPREAKYFVPATDPLAKGAFKGIRSGIPYPDEKTYINHSILNITTETPAILMTAAEVSFLKAEGKLKGWNVGSGTVQQFYEDGVTKSFAQWGAGGVSDYLKSTAVPANYVDLYQPTLLNTNAASTISPMWDDNASDATKLERIITQKWIAGYPEGCEAWAEQRRTGYPKIFKVQKNDSQGVISTDLGVRRLEFSSTEKATNPTGYTQAVQLLGGTDNGATRLWWDKP
ncbi:RagB/SusD family nutrient uptake outer membrane protein [Chitinophagaceae bacterium 26-R-25]|nr:RagB/SusD family nutrient uptake outer membrane protein [Chitinophagaceae bacterium 26-R-25]